MIARDTPGWAKFLAACTVPATPATKWAPIFASTLKDNSFSKGATELPQFLGNVLHESALLQRLEEDLNYSAARIAAVWPSRFRTADEARPFAGKPHLLAEKVYGGRMGNTLPGDGWLYRGRGLIQLTGKDGYAMAGKLVGQDLVEVPDLAAQPHYALEIAIAWWEDRIPDDFLADTTGYSIRRRINGGTVGLKETQALARAAERALA